MLFRRRRHRRMPGLNTTSTADISFILLAFFLMTSSMDTDKGLLAQLPAADKTQEIKNVDFKESDVLRLSLDASDTLRCNGVVVDAALLKEQVRSFVSISTDKNVILLSADRQTSYDAYFNVQHTVAEAYLEVRNKIALERFGHDYRQCNSAERDSVKALCPWRVSEEDMAQRGEEAAQGMKNAPQIGSNALQRGKGGES